MMSTALRKARNCGWAGSEIEHTHGLAGHSDADVALHAITDAVLGAIGDGDIGTHFPPSDPQWKGARSAQFLEHAVKLAASQGYAMGNVDLTIICEAPKIGPHRPAMRNEVARITGLEESAVSIKATTTEKTWIYRPRRRHRCTGRRIVICTGDRFMKTRIFAATLAASSLLSAQGVAAQQACVESDDLADTVTYAMPMLYDAVQAPCSASFADSRFMSTEADAFVDQFRQRQDAAWPGTLRLLKVFVTRDAAKEGGGDPMLAALEQMSPEALRPLVDVIIGQMVNDELAKEIKGNTCADIAEAMELLAPLPPENIALLTAFIARQADLDQPSICGVTPKAG